MTLLLAYCLAMDIAAIVTILLPVSNLTNLHCDYNSLVRIPALKLLLQSWKAACDSMLSINLFRLPCGYDIDIVIQRLNKNRPHISYSSTLTTKAESSILTSWRLNVDYAYILFTTTQLMRIVFKSFLAFK